MVYLPRGRKSEPPRILYAFFFYLSCCFHCVLCVVCAHETPRLDAYAVSCFFSRCHKSSSERCYRIPNYTFASILEKIVWSHEFSFSCLFRIFTQLAF